MATTATVKVTKTDGSVMNWNVTDEQCDKVIKLLLAKPRQPSSSNNGKRRGPKAKVPIEGELLNTALWMRADGMSREAIARELKVPSRTLGRAFDRWDSNQEVDIE